MNSDNATFSTAPALVPLPRYQLSYNMERSQNLKYRMWANAQPDGRPAEHRWRPLFNATKFG